MWLSCLFAGLAIAGALFTAYSLGRISALKEHQKDLKHIEGELGRLLEEELKRKNQGRGEDAVVEGET